jgi:transposase
VTQRILIDRAGALVVGEDRESGKARVHPVFAGFCKDWGVEVSACRPYRAHQGQDGVGRRLREAQRDRWDLVRELRCSRGASRAVDGRC